MYLTYHTCFTLSTLSLYFVILHIIQFIFLYILNYESAFFKIYTQKKNMIFFMFFILSFLTRFRLFCRIPGNQLPRQQFL